MNSTESRMALEAVMRQRVVTDWKTDFWPALLLGIITCGIYSIYILYKLIDRRLQHFERVISLRYYLIQVLKEQAEASGRTAELQNDITEMENLHVMASNRDRMGDKSPVMWTILSMFITPFYVYYFLNDDFRAHEANEHMFILKASEVMQKLGMNNQQIVTTMMVPERNFITFLLLSFVTCGIYGWYWYYTLITDPNNHFDNHAAWENYVYTVLFSEPGAQVTQ